MYAGWAGYRGGVGNNGDPAPSHRPQGVRGVHLLGLRLQQVSNIFPVWHFCFLFASVADTGCLIQISDPHQKFQYLIPKNLSKLSETWSGLFIPDPDPNFIAVQDPGSRGQKGNGSGIRICNIAICEIPAVTCHCLRPKMSCLSL